jgi:hypothetical protein
MLAAFNPAVTSPASPTPEQASVDHALDLFWTLVERLKSAADLQLPIHHVEETLFRQLLLMGHSLLAAFVASSGQGDVGPTLTLPGERPTNPPRVWPKLDGSQSRPYLSIFGEISITRACYGRGRVEATPLDARLHLPRRQYSYLLQQWLGAFVIGDAHAEAIKKLETILGLGISVKPPEDLNREQASDVEPFQNHLATPDPTEEGPILVVTADCKGVPLVKSALGPEAAPLPTAANPRRGKGDTIQLVTLFGLSSPEDDPAFDWFIDRYTPPWRSRMGRPHDLVIGMFNYGGIVTFGEDSIVREWDSAQGTWSSEHEPMPYDSWLGMILAEGRDYLAESQ